ncbi:MAG: hypothetical protein ACREFL_00385 [Stellaceae bacterium]
METGLDGFSEQARRYRRILAALGEEDLKRKVNYAGRLGSAAGTDDKLKLKRSDKALAAD